MVALPGAAAAAAATSSHGKGVQSCCYTADIFFDMLEWWTGLMEECVSLRSRVRRGTGEKKHQHFHCIVKAYYCNYYYYYYYYYHYYNYYYHYYYYCLSRI